MRSPAEPFRFLEGMEGFGPSYREAVDDYLLALSATGRSRMTIADRRQLLFRFGRHSGERLAVAPTDIATFLANLSVCRNSLAQYMITLRLFFGHCLSRGWIPANPVIALPQIKYRPEPIRATSLQEVRRALAVATERQRDIVIILVATGLRAGELAAIREGDIDWEAGIVRVRGKGGWPRSVALGDAATGALRRQVGRLTYQIIRDEFQKLQRRGGLPGFTAHRLRHTFSLAFVRAGGRIDLLKTLLGHRSLSVTMMYLTDSDEEALEAQRALNLADRL